MQPDPQPFSQEYLKLSAEQEKINKAGVSAHPGPYVPIPTGFKGGNHRVGKGKGYGKGSYHGKSHGPVTASTEDHS